MKKFICLVLAIVFVFSLSGCGIFKTEEEPCSNGHSFTITYTNSCIEDGFKVLTCSVCGLIEKYEAIATGHQLNKNECINCGYKAKRISQFSLEYRKEIAKEIELIAPFYSDVDTLIEIGKLYMQTKRENENKPPLAACPS